MAIKTDRDIMDRESNMEEMKGKKRGKKVNVNMMRKIREMMST